MCAFPNSSDTKPCLKSENNPKDSKSERDSVIQQDDEIMIPSACSSSDLVIAQWPTKILAALHSRIPHYRSPYNVGIAKDSTQYHLDAERSHSQLTPSPSEASIHPVHSPSAFDITQKLLEAQPRSINLELSQMQNSPWTPSFPPHTYYITPPSRTPEAAVASPSVFDDAPVSSNAQIFHQYDQFSAQDHRRIYSVSPSLNHHASPGLDDYYLTHTTDSEHQVVEDSSRSKEAPYAELLYRCLFDAPENQMILKDIYEWFRNHTDKTRNPENKGWMNSIRHNLSMNQASDSCS
jgi:hypothetical protein